MNPQRVPYKGYRRLEDWSLKRYLGHHYPTFEQEMMTSNLQRLLVINVLLMITETVLLILPEPGFSYKGLLIGFLLANALMLVGIWLMLDLKFGSTAWRQFLVAIDVSIKFMLAAALSMSSQGVFDHLHLVIGTMFVMVTVTYLRNSINGILLLAVTLIYIAVLPQYQPNVNQQFILSGNLIIFALGAWVVGYLINRDRGVTFKAKQELEDLLKRDLMTKLYNHDTILELVNREVEAARADGLPLSILLLDLDDFKLVNDVHGHLKGDEVLLQVVEVLRKTTRSTDLIGRYGVEEFLILFTRTELPVAQKISERIRQAIEAVEISGVSVTVSGGLTQLTEESALSFIKSADDKLYEAKRAGKNRIITT
jgi:diguanylate cyclase (GGDEF)-like protein